MFGWVAATPESGICQAHAVMMQMLSSIARLGVLQLEIHQLVSVDCHYVMICNEALHEACIGSIGFSCEWQISVTAGDNLAVPDAYGTLAHLRHAVWPVRLGCYRSVGKLQQFMCLSFCLSSCQTAVVVT